MYEVYILNDLERTFIHTMGSDNNNPKLLNGSIKQGINTIDTFECDIAINNPGYNKLRPLRTIVEVFNTKTNKVDFRGRFLLPKQTMSSEGMIVKRVLFESELAYLMDTNQTYGEYHDISVEEFLKIIIKNHNDLTTVDKRFSIGKVTVKDNNDSLYRFLNYEKTLNVIKDKLIDRLGGEIRIRHENGINFIDYLERIGEAKKTEIRVAKNMQNLVEEQDPTSIVNRITPLGAKVKKDNAEGESIDTEERLTIAGINQGLPYIDDEGSQNVFGVIAGTVTFDDVEEVANLKRKGEEFLKANNFILKKYSVEALDLSLIDLDIDSFELGNEYPLINPVMGVDESVRVIEKSIDIFEPFKSKMTIGNKFDDIKAYQNKMSKANSKIDDIRYSLATTNNRLNDANNKIDEAYNQLDDIRYNSKTYYMLDIRNKKLKEYKRDLQLVDTTVMQSFDLDLKNNVGYFVQLKYANKKDLILCKVDLSTNDIIGTMYLNGFGHGTNMCIEERGLDTYIWIECLPYEGSNGNFYGERLCRFKFENNVTHEESSGQIIEVLHGHKNTYPAIDQLNNRLCVKSYCNKVHYYSIFDLDSVLTNEPVMISQFKIPSHVNTDLPLQGFDVHGKYIYNYEGKQAKYEIATIENEDGTITTEEIMIEPSIAYVTVFNEKGFIQYREIVKGFDDMYYREAEGIKLKQLDANNFNLFIGFASGKKGERKANLFKYEDLSVESR